MITDQIKTTFKFYDIQNLNNNRDIIDKVCTDNSNFINIYWLGKHSYNPIWDLQKEAHELRVQQKINDIIFLLEHDHVYTLGKNANENHILPSKPKNAEIIKIDRGGDVTYHGPGQLVGYPILDLHNYKMSISWYLKLLSNSIINMLALTSDLPVPGGALLAKRLLLKSKKLIKIIINVEINLFIVVIHIPLRQFVISI